MSRQARLHTSFRFPDYDQCASPFHDNCCSGVLVTKSGCAPNTKRNAVVSTLRGQLMSVKCHKEYNKPTNKISPCVVQKEAPHYDSCLVFAGRIRYQTLGKVTWVSKSAPLKADQSIQNCCDSVCGCVCDVCWLCAAVCVFDLVVCECSSSQSKGVG